MGVVGDMFFEHQGAPRRSGWPCCIALVGLGVAAWTSVQAAGLGVYVAVT